MEIIVSFLAGIGAGLGTGFAGMSAAVVISPILTAFLGITPYEAIGIGLASDVLASAVSAYTYKKSGNIDIKNGLVMLMAVLVYTLIGSHVSHSVEATSMGSFSSVMMLLLGIKFLVSPVNKQKPIKYKVKEGDTISSIAEFYSITEDSICELNNIPTYTKLETGSIILLNAKRILTSQQRVTQSLIGGSVVGFICGFIGAGGGMMMLIILNSVLGYDLKVAVGTSVFIMTATALTGAISHFALAGLPNMTVLIVCSLSTLLFARLGSVYANKADDPVKIGKLIGGLLITIFVLITGVNFLG